MHGSDDLIVVVAAAGLCIGLIGLAVGIVVWMAKFCA